MNNIADVSFIIVNYNTKQLLKDLLDFFDASNPPFTYSVVVVDNKSSDGSVAMLSERERRPTNLTAILNDENVGYGRAVNRALSSADSRYVCILNTDVILTGDVLAALWGYLEKNPENGVCSPIVCNKDMSIQGFFYTFSAIFLYSDFIKKCYSTYKKFRISISRLPIKVDGVAGAFIFLRRSVIEGGELFDPNFFFYFEDTDLAHTLHDRGIPAYILPDQRIIHLGGQSGEGSNWKLFYESKYLYVRKHFGPCHLRYIYYLDLVKVNMKFLKYKFVTLFHSTPKVLQKNNFYRELSNNLKTLSPVK
ncbi:MAG TPA: glycosyltransferase family 2 protein [Dissulfurispiraceae bacterium]|nr:glycosyltransferase family 2 protein [Dissulfurispiraceae bacterium]